MQAYQLHIHEDLQYATGTLYTRECFQSCDYESQPSETITKEVHSRLHAGFDILKRCLQRRHSLLAVILLSMNLALR